MSDGVFTITTPHPDVAGLAEGFIERVDGEHLLLPLPEPVPAGTPLQFMIALADGTAAFMGAGVCADVTDQGDAAVPEHRFETLLAGLQFDERSQPVYDYIVAIRAQAIAIQEQQAAGAGGGEFGADEEPTEFIDTQAVLEQAGQAQAAEMEIDADDAAFSASEAPAELASALDEPGAQASRFLTAPPVAVPTGVLHRPAIGVHWQPASPRRPQPSASSGLFRFNGSALPAPAAPPFPELDRSQWVQPAPRPGDGVDGASASASAPPASLPAADASFDDAQPELEPEAALDAAAPVSDYEEPDADFESEPAAEPEPPVEVQEDNPWDA